MNSNDEKNEAQTPAEVDDFDNAFDSDLQDAEKDFFEGFWTTKKEEQLGHFY